MKAGANPAATPAQPSAAGYSGTPLARKLGIKAGSSVVVIACPDGYRALLEPLPQGVLFERDPSAQTDIVHLFVRDREALAGHLAALRKTLKPQAAVWVSWPKKASKVPTNVTEDVVRELALPLGFVDIKVCAVTEVWSGLKLVVRKALR
jgi:bifunctional DNA-binding transcriptional regulator/antitoxin component of YhaV-PrlF toxin-antitoxin module